MKKFEYETLEVLPEDMFQTLNDAGNEGWEFMNLVVQQKMEQPKRIIGGMSQPQMMITFLLIFKREKAESILIDKQNNI
jgi:hypothetical protein